MRVKGGVLAALVLVAGGCAVRLGGPAPESYTAVALADATADPVALGNQLREAGADLVLVSAERDSAWFARLAEQTGLTLSGPGPAGPLGLALLSRIKVLGDSALSLPAGGGQLYVMDALYEVDKYRTVDLMLMRMSEGVAAADAVRALLSYYATDVGGTAAVLLALQSASPQAADSAALLLRSAFGNVLACGGDGSASAAAGGPGTLRFFYGPQARIDCESGRIFSTAPPAILGRVVVGR